MAALIITLTLTLIIIPCKIVVNSAILNNIIE
jgi:hypothetical protein